MREAAGSKNKRRTVCLPLDRLLPPLRPSAPSLCASCREVAPESKSQLVNWAIYSQMPLCLLPSVAKPGAKPSSARGDFKLDLSSLRWAKKANLSFPQSLPGAPEPVSADGRQLELESRSDTTDCSRGNLKNDGISLGRSLVRSSFELLSWGGIESRDSTMS